MRQVIVKNEDVEFTRPKRNRRRLVYPNLCRAPKAHNNARMWTPQLPDVAGWYFAVTHELSEQLSSVILQAALK